MRLIDVDALIKKCKELSAIEWNKKAAPVSWADAYDSFIDVIEEAPTAPTIDPESLRPKGRWDAHHRDSRGYTNGFGCSNCWYITFTDYSMKKCEYNFCPHCGADMREEPK
jgi:hypothetical protein